MRTPVVLVTGVDPEPVDHLMLGLTWDLPRAVVVRHHLDARSSSLTRIVSDSSGILEHETVPLDHACATCALSADIVPILERLGKDRRWSSIVAGLPRATEAEQLASILAWDRVLSRRLRLAAVLTAISSDRTAERLLSDDLLRDDDPRHDPEDERGLGEVACSLIEYADAVVIDGEPGDPARALVRALSRPDAPVIVGTEHVDAQRLAGRRHVRRTAHEWRYPLDGGRLPELDSSRAWRLELNSPRPLHPRRLLDNLERLGAGGHRSRGGFWLPTRPGFAQDWAGAGSQLSIGAGEPWGRRQRRTRLVVTGLGAPPDDLPHAFRDSLATERELADSSLWSVNEDGFEPWLGEITRAA